jgi:uncharacterized RDD family membrane protein YckC
MGLPYNPYDPPQAYWEPPREDGTLPLASRWQRLGASLLDSLFDGVLGWGPALLLHSAGLDPFPRTSGATISWMPSALLLVCMSFVPNGFQWWLISRSGQSIGKKVVGTRIVTLDGQVAGLMHGVVLRWFPQLTLTIVNTIVTTFAPWTKLLKGLFSGIISAIVLFDPLFIFGSEKRCIHDYIAGTRVVHAGRQSEGRPTSEWAAP